MLKMINFHPQEHHLRCIPLFCFPRILRLCTVVLSTGGHYLHLSNHNPTFGKFTSKSYWPIISWGLTQTFNLCFIIAGKVIPMSKLIVRLLPAVDGLGWYNPNLVFFLLMTQGCQRVLSVWNPDTPSRNAWAQRAPLQHCFQLHTQQQFCR